MERIMTVHNQMKAGLKEIQLDVYSNKCVNCGNELHLLEISYDNNPIFHYVCPNCEEKFSYNLNNLKKVKIDGDIRCGKLELIEEVSRK